MRRAGGVDGLSPALWYGSAQGPSPTASGRWTSAPFRGPLVPRVNVYAQRGETSEPPTRRRGCSQSPLLSPPPMQMRPASAAQQRGWG